MYIEILNKTVEAYLKGKPVLSIEIKLTPFIYKTIQLELNSILKFNTTVPIEEIEINHIKLYDRTVTLVNSKELDGVFEIELIKAFANKGTTV